MRAWRLLCLVEPDRIDQTAYHAMGMQLKSGVVLDSDLRKAVSLLAPSLVLNKSYRELREDNGSQPFRRLGDIVWPRMVISDQHGAEELLDTLCAMPDRTGRILDLATAQLQSALELGGRTRPDRRRL